MREILTTHAFVKDLRLSKKRGKPIAKLTEIIEALANKNHLPKKFHPHRLTGPLHDCFECHVAPDWLLIYRCNDDTLELVRLGSHSDFFK